MLYCVYNGVEDVKLYGGGFVKKQLMSFVYSLVLKAGENDDRRDPHLFRF